jgi:hypothetical protein
MRRVEPIRNLDGQIESGSYFHRAATDAMLQRHTVQVLHDNECLPVLLINLMNCANVRMVQSRSGPSFAFESF